MNNQQHQPGQERNQDRPNEHAGPESGQQGIDKAPGEEPSQDNVQYMQEALKGKKVDADLEQEEERPGDQPSI